MNFVERKYLLLLQPQLEMFKELRDGLFNFRCPFCKDSKKSKFKARGYVFTYGNKTKFKCHNCGAGHSFNEFLQITNPRLYGLYKVESFGNKHKKKPELFKEIVSVSDTFKQLKEHRPLKNCVALSEILDKSHTLYLVKQYAIDRKIPEKYYSSLYACESLNLIGQEIDKMKKVVFPNFPVLVIPFFTWNNKFSYIQCRAVGREDKAFRYTTFEASKDGLKVWGIPWVDWSKPVHIFEGPIDAMFVENSIALGGAADVGVLQWLLTKKEKSDLIFCFDNDYATNPQVLKLLQSRVRNGYKVLLYNKSFKWKDINKAITDGGWSGKQVNEYIGDRTFSDLRAKLELTQIGNKRHK